MEEGDWPKGEMEKNIKKDKIFLLKKRRIWLILNFIKLIIRGYSGLLLVIMHIYLFFNKGLVA